MWIVESRRLWGKGELCEVIEGGREKGWELGRNLEGEIIFGEIKFLVLIIFNMYF